jgi:hypothetical protein
LAMTMSRPSPSDFIASMLSIIGFGSHISRGRRPWSRSR